MLTILLFQSLMVLARWVFFLDIIGGFIMMIAVGVGWYAYSEDMDLTYTCFWGMMCFIEGVFAIVRLIHYSVNSIHPLFSKDLPDAHNFASGILVAVPVSMLLGSLLAWQLYKDYDDPAVEPLNQPLRYYDDREAARPRPFAGGRSFQAFQGEGNRLGAR
jgi:hypothetical protein